MEAIRQTQKKYCSVAIIVAIAVGLLFILAGLKPVGKGVILGTLFSIINFILIGETIPLRIGHSKRKTFFISLGSIYFRFIILAIPILVAIKTEQFSLISVVAGIFLIQILILIEHVAKYILSIRNKQIL